MNKPIKWGKVALRLLVLPFYAGYFAIHLIKLLLVSMCDFLLYGGEMITYNKHMNLMTISKTYDLIKQQYEK